MAGEKDDEEARIYLAGNRVSVDVFYSLLECEQLSGSDDIV